MRIPEMAPRAVVSASRSLPAPGTVDVLHFQLDVSSERLHALTSLLSRDELERAARFRSQKDRDRWYAARGQLRESLGAALGQDPRDVAIEPGPHGKPRIARTGSERGICFSLSHSHEAAVLCLAWGTRVGADIEKITGDADMVRMALTSFHGAEAASIQAMPAGERTLAFFRCWTRKEAYVKAVGQGLCLDFQDFQVSTALDEPARLLTVGKSAEEARRWKFFDIPAGPRFAAALAVEVTGEDAPVSVRFSAPLTGGL